MCVCWCVYEQVCVCVLFKFSYQLCAAKIISHIEFQRSLIMMMSCIADVSQASLPHSPLSTPPPSPPAAGAGAEGRFRSSVQAAPRWARLICGYRADAATGKPERVRVEILAIAL